MIHLVHFFVPICFSLIFFTAANNLTRTKREEVVLQPYNYRVQSRFGQRNWGYYYPKCSLKSQSPINIQLNKARYGDFPSTLRTTNINTKPLEVLIRNNGYTALVSYYWACCAPKIYGGPLTDVYEFIGMHFHWGKDDSSGTEHSINDEHGAMEVHMIFKNVRYETKEKALDYDDGLCVFALRYKCDKDAKPFQLLEGIRQTPNWGDTVKSFYPDTHPLTEFILSDFHYAYYQGSLTTPPCSESVKWIVNLNTMPMNCTQLNYFRAMRDKGDNEISGNHREVQPRNNREVYVA